MTEDGDGVFPVAVLIDELRSGDVQLRLNSIRRLQVIAKALGTERTRLELIPYLNESIDDEEDEVLLAMAEELGNLVPYVGGPTHAPSLLLPLESLCNTEETAVRDKAVVSLNSLAVMLGALQNPKEQLHNDYVAMIRRLGGSEWATARAACCYLLATVYGLLSDGLKQEMLQIYTTLCRDEEPIVRRSACVNLKGFAEIISPSIALSTLIPIYAAQARDSQDSVRLLSVQNCSSLIRSINSKEEVQQKILPIIRNYGNDDSWRVRYMLADNFTLISSALGEAVDIKDMISAFVRLATDTESEVRTSVAFKVYDFCALLKVDQVVKDIIPVVQKLVNDTSQHVRASLAGVIMKISAILGKELTISNLLPLFLILLQDEFPDVRLNVISKLNSVNEVIGIDMLSRNLLPAVVKLAEDNQWRVRLAIINEIPVLAQQLGITFFDEELSDLCLNWLTDKVYEIRQAATNILKKIAAIFGQEWTRVKLIPRILQISANKNYLYRLAVLYAIKELATVMDKDSIQRLLLPTVLNLTSDPVPNIRFNCCKTLESIMPSIDPDVISQSVKVTLMRLHDDQDVDVRFFAGKALVLV